jgi:hypothetical protein
MEIEDVRSKTEIRERARNHDVRGKRGVGTRVLARSGDYRAGDRRSFAHP